MARILVPVPKPGRTLFRVLVLALFVFSALCGFTRTEIGSFFLFTAAALLLVRAWCGKLDDPDFVDPSSPDTRVPTPLGDVEKWS